MKEKDKKLLLYGGSMTSVQILNVAHEKGFKVGVIDYYEKSYCKSLADFSHQTDVFDLDAVCKIFIENNYDGIITGYSENLLQPYAKVCDRLKVPCYGSSHLFDLSTNKQKFKALCKKHGVPVMPEFSHKDVLEKEGPFPLVVKPVDSAGGFGISICNSLDEFTNYYEQALQFSPSKNVIIEKCAQGKEATFFFYFNKGQIYYTIGGDRLMIKQKGVSLPLPVGYIFPTNVRKEWIDLFIANLSNLFKEEGFKDGMAFAQAFIEDDGIYLCEIGYRLTPSFETFAIKEFYGFDPIAGLVEFAIGNNVDCKELDKSPKDESIANITFLVRSGIISKYEGIDSVKQLPYVIKVLPAWSLGHQIKEEEYGTLKQVGLRILLKGKDQEDLVKNMDYVFSQIQILDENGEDMTIREYTYKDLSK